MESWILKRKPHNLDVNVKIYGDYLEGGKMVSKELEDYTGDGFPGEYDEIIPVWNPNAREWAWGGTEAELGRFIKRFKLRDKYNEVITSVERHNLADPFFTNKFFTKNPIRMFHTFAFKESDPKHVFLRLCWAGAEKVEVFGKTDDMSIVERNMKKYLLIQSSQIKKEENKSHKKELEAAAVLNRATPEILQLLGIVLNQTMDEKASVDMLEEKFFAMKSSDEKLRAFDVRLFYEDMTEQEGLTKYGRMNIGELNKRKRIVVAIHKNMITYTKGGWKIFNKKMEGTQSLESIVSYLEQYPELDEKIANL